MSKHYEIGSFASTGNFGYEYAHSLTEVKDSVRWLKANGYALVGVNKVVDGVRSPVKGYKPCNLNKPVWG